MTSAIRNQLRATSASPSLASSTPSPSLPSTLKRYYRYIDLYNAGLVKSRQTLANWIKLNNSPKEFRSAIRACIRLTKSTRGLGGNRARRRRATHRRKRSRKPQRNARKARAEKRQLGAPLATRLWVMENYSIS